MGEVRISFKSLYGKSEGKRLFGKPGRRWEDNIKMDIKGIGCGNVD
jgi:hypothetical protein